MYIKRSLKLFICLLAVLVLSTNAFSHAPGDPCGTIVPSEIQEKVKNNVYQVVAHLIIKQYALGLERNLDNLKSGTAFQLSERLFVTNYHIVSPDGNLLKATYYIIDRDGRKHEARLVGTDFVEDIALLETGVDLPYLSVPIAPLNSLRVADRVFALGYQFGHLNYTEGTISSLQAPTFMRRIVIDVTINSGSSGGPTFTCDGRIIGINVSIFPPSSARHFGLVIPIEIVQSIVEKFKEGKKVSYGSLGDTKLITAYELTASRAKELFSDEEFHADQGVVVIKTDNRLKTSRLPLESGDTMTHVNNTIINSELSFRQLVFYTPPGNALTVRIIRKNGEVRFDRLFTLEANEEELKEIKKQNPPNI